MTNPDLPPEPRQSLDDLELAPAAQTPPPAPSPTPVATPDPLPTPQPPPASSSEPAPESDSPWQELADPEDIRKNKGAAMIGYVFFFIPLITADKSRFARFHANQSLVILCIGGGLTVGCFLAAKIIEAGLSFLAPINYFISMPLFLLVGISWIASLCMAVTGIVHAYNGEMTELPVIGAYRILK